MQGQSEGAFNLILRLLANQSKQWNLVSISLGFRLDFHVKVTELLRKYFYID